MVKETTHYWSLTYLIEGRKPHSCINNKAKEFEWFMRIPISGLLNKSEAG